MYNLQVMADPPPPLPPPPPSTHSESMQGILLIAVLLNAALFGLVTQQFYAYWVSGFRDPTHLRLFVVVQYLLVTFQSALMWNFSYNLFIIDPQPTSGASLWEGPVNSLCQLFLILLANLSLASRINGLAKSRIQSATVAALSTVAFVFGMVTIIVSWRSQISASYTRYTSCLWHAMQALAECLITFFLSRALLKSRSGIRSSDSVVYYLVRNVIQIGLVATTWAIAALATWFLLPQNSTYRLFDITSGTVYTQAMFEGLLSRRRLRKHIFPSTYLDLGMNTQQSQVSARVGNPSRLANVSLTPCDLSGPESGPGFTPKGDVMELESLSTGKEDHRHKI